jgi:predicted nucleic acid-binding protein
MRRIFWDAMLFVYLLGDYQEFTQGVDKLLARSKKRGDSLFTSCLALGEVMAGSERLGQPAVAIEARDTLAEIGFKFLPFDQGAISIFSELRGKQRLKVADAIHLSCAGSAGIDLFLTGDKQLLKLDVPGIQFIAEFNTPIL